MKRPVPKIWDIDALRVPNVLYPYLEGAEQFPFRADVLTPDLVNAWWLAEIAYLVYVDDESLVRGVLARSGFSTVQTFDRDGTHCTVAHNDEAIVVAFRGTEAHDARDVFADIRVRPVPFPSGGHVHRGFRDALARVWRWLSTYIDAVQTGQSLWFTGHSLGAALATLAAAQRPDTTALYTFGSPKVGLYDFSITFDKPAYRFVHADDAAVLFPPGGVHGALTAEGYSHVGTPVVIDRGGRVFEGDARPGFRARMSQAARSLTPSGVIDHLAVYYAVKLWNALVDDCGEHRAHR